jgi:peptidoglycan/LPS O-acetylase OafA/YrhL
MSAATASTTSDVPSRAARPGFFGLELLDNRYPALHGLRVLAILSVIQIHVTWDFHDFVNLHLPEWFVQRSFAAFFGMDCFFVLSGFLIGSILIRSIDTTGTQQIRRFYLRRIFRTFPSYYVVLTILVLWLPRTPEQQANLWAEYTYLTNFVPLGRAQVVMLWGWSLSLEEQFYLAVPLLFVILRRLPTDKARVVFLALFAAAGLVMRIVVYWHGRPWDDIALYDNLYFRTITRFDPIVAGVLLAVIEARWGKQVAAWLAHPAHRAMLGVPALGCLWLLMVPELFGEENVQIVHLFLWGTVTSVMYLCLVPLILHGDGPIVRFLGQPIWRRLATLGYGVYLVHIPILDHLLVPYALELHHDGTPLWIIWPLTLAVCAVLSFAVGYVMHILIEKPSLRVREWLAA